MHPNDPKFYRPDKTFPTCPTGGFRITEIHAFTCIDEDNTEGVIGSMNSAGQWMPFVCADRARLDSLRRVAQLIAQQTGKIVKVTRFSVREDVEEIKP